MALVLHNCHLREANAVVELFHRHHKPDRGHKFSVAVCNESGGVLGVAIAGRPKARALDCSRTLEVTRLCVVRRSHNVCSMLYGACARAAAALGYHTVITYTLEAESGASLRAAGWHRDGVIRSSGNGWSNRPGRSDEHPERKVRWSKRVVRDTKPHDSAQASPEPSED